MIRVMYLSLLVLVFSVDAFAARGRGTEAKPEAFRARGETKRFGEIFREGTGLEVLDVVARKLGAEGRDAMTFIGENVGEAMKASRSVEPLIQGVHAIIGRFANYEGSIKNSAEGRLVLDALIGMQTRLMSLAVARSGESMFLTEAQFETFQAKVDYVRDNLPERVADPAAFKETAQLVLDKILEVNGDPAEVAAFRELPRDKQVEEFRRCRL